MRVTPISASRVANSCSGHPKVQPCNQGITVARKRNLFAGLPLPVLGGEVAQLSRTRPRTVQAARPQLAAAELPSGDETGVYDLWLGRGVEPLPTHTGDSHVATLGVEVSFWRLVPNRNYE
eukprot:COSAG02_NODE_1915_length_10394_cov_5.038757_6_plen_121_part_00